MKEVYFPALVYSDQKQTDIFANDSQYRIWYFQFSVVHFFDRSMSGCLLISHKRQR